MHFELHRIRARELMREADAHRLAGQARSAPPEPRAAPESESESVKYVQYRVTAPRAPRGPIPR
ncbi:hypothetical protein CP972_16775 [Streptomyces prasinus]|uniref:Uncharacterized protein n=1 Tax=Streptomyces prasinus TaxID=67345 RepID=A0ABX6AZI5_9ACTN|nr:hypothetical protein CP972_16775 [Streptomyces prasinus]